MTLKNLTLAMGLSASAVLTAPVGAAEDSTGYSGNHCSPANGEATHQIRRYMGTIYNASSTPLEASCPIASMNHNNQAGLWEAKIYYTRSVYASNAALSCDLLSRYPTGEPIAKDSALDDGPFATEGVFTMHVGRSSFEGYYELRCTLPKGSYIASYLVHEMDLM